MIGGRRGRQGAELGGGGGPLICSLCWESLQESHPQKPFPGGFPQGIKQPKWGCPHPTGLPNPSCRGVQEPAPTPSPPG